ncbi:MAG: cell wall-binding repeat-containing protein [Terrimesophilobacter sp.]
MRDNLSRKLVQASPVKRAVAIVSAALMIAAGLVAASPVGPASALNVSEFDRGNIISDANFYDSNAMSEAQIQAFLNAQIGTCNNSLCLNILQQDTYSRPADRTVCAAYLGAAAEPVSRMLFKIQQACGISAKVLLVTLQKEMGLVTSKAPTQGRLNAAMGYACPDTAPCNSDKAGFYNQVYMAAWQFKRYSVPDVWGGFWAGQARNIQYSPNSLCGSKWVTIKNRATAALYNYTPYTPTDGALAAYPGPASGADATCGSYGNRNFWFYYYNWFGSPTDIHPTGITIDRQGGVDRFDTALQISQQAFPDPATNPVPVVYITDGMNFPDALSAAPAAAKDRGPLLLVKQNELPTAVETEIMRLKPAKIVVAGMEGSISEAVFTQLSKLAPTVRVGGVDRFDTSRLIAQATFAAGTTTTAFIATGTMFPDALSASAAAGSLGAPVILVRGTDTAVDQPTIDLLQSLGVTKIFVTGGPAVVTPELVASLALVPGVTSVTRYGGDNRFIVSAATNRASFTKSGMIYVASGFEFPDALAGAAVAGMNKVPLYLTPSTCIYTSVLEDMGNFGATTMTILGGTGILGSGVSGFTNCH